MSVCTAGSGYANTTPTDDSATSAVPCQPLGGPFAGMGQGIGLQYLTGQTPELCAFKAQDATYNMNTTGIPSTIKSNTSAFTMTNGEVLGGICTGSGNNGHTFVGVQGSFYGQFFIEIGGGSVLSETQCKWLLAQCTDQTKCGC